MTSKSAILLLCVLSSHSGLALASDYDTTLAQEVVFKHGLKKDAADLYLRIDLKQNLVRGDITSKDGKIDCDFESNQGRITNTERKSTNDILIDSPFLGRLQSYDFHNTYEWQCTCEKNPRAQLTIEIVEHGGGLASIEMGPNDVTDGVEVRIKSKWGTAHFYSKPELEPLSLGGKIRRFFDPPRQTVIRNGFGYY